MFEKQASDIKTDIRIYENHSYMWETSLLKGHVRAFEDDSGDYEVFAAPHVERLSQLDTHPSPTADCRYAFNEARAKGLFLGTYASLDMVRNYLGDLEKFFTLALSEKGAVGRVLRAENNKMHLVPTNQVTEESFGDALKVARDQEIFVALRQGKELPLREIIGRVFRSLANTLGINYFITEDRRAEKPHDYKSVTFTYEGIGAFRFENNGPGRHVQLTRLSYNNTNRLYYPTFEGPANHENMQRHVFNWLLDAMRDVTARDLKSEFDYAAFVENRARAVERFYGTAKLDGGTRVTGGNKVILRLVN